MIIKEIFWKSDLALVAGPAQTSCKPAPFPELPEFLMQSALPKRLTISK
jgi:hypothetical protein